MPDHKGTARPTKETVSPEFQTIFQRLLGLKEEGAGSLELSKLEFCLLPIVLPALKHGDQEG